MILFQLKGAAKSLSVELESFMSENKEIKTGYTKQAYSKARMKIKHEGYIELNDQLLEEYYIGEHTRYNEYRLLGIDGSGVQMPYGEKIAEEFGNANNNAEYINLSWSTVVYDLMNNLTIDACLNRYGQSEQQLVIEQLRRIKSQEKQKQADIIVADRGFPSLELLVEMRGMGYEYIIRYNGESFLKETKALIDSPEEEMIVDISLIEGNRRKNNETIRRSLEQGCDKSIRVRIVKIKLSNGQMEYLITSLLNKNQFTADDFKKIYNLRWNEEVYFNFLKNVLEVENFSGKTVESIRQDYYSRIVVSNIHSIITQEAQKEVETEIESNQKLKYKKYKINRSVTYGIMKERIYNLLLEENDIWEKEYDQLVQIAKKHKIAVIGNRQFPRKRKGNLKFPINKRRVI